MENENEKLLEAGLVRRYHTIPDDGRGQTVAEHSWGVAVLIAKYHPNPSANLLKAALYHDLAESITGDAPANAKWDNAVLARLYDELEDAINVKYGWHVDLTVEEENWLNAADIAELLFYCHRRTNMADVWHQIRSRASNHISRMRTSGMWPPELVV